MVCKDIEHLIPAYVLDALSPEETLQVESHLEGCPWCSALVREQREVVANLALGVEQVPPPQRILARIMEEVTPPPPSRDVTPTAAGGQPRRRPVSVLTAFAYAAAPIALLLLGGVLAFTLRTSGKMDDLKETNQALTEQVAGLQRGNATLSQELALLRDGSNLVAQKVSELSELNEDRSMVAEVAEKVNRLTEGNNAVTAEVIQLSLGNESLSRQMDDLTASGEQLLEVLRTQRSMIYMLTLPDTRALNLEAQEGTTSQGSLMFSFDKQRSVFVATGLESLPPTRRYDIWLRKGDTDFNLGSLFIDETGWGVALLDPDHTMAEYQWIGVTVESTSRFQQPTGEELVLWGYLSSADSVGP